MNFCSHCGAPVSLRVPPGDDRPRFVCERCRTVHYTNPKVVVGCIAEWEERILVCRRAIEPRYGRWTIPAGYLENGETVSEGASREAYEEARADVQILAPYAIFNLTFISQIYLIFRARLLSCDVRPGEESLETRLLSEKDIPWDDLAFDVVREALKLFFHDRLRQAFPFHVETIAARSGSGFTRSPFEEV